MSNEVFVVIFTSFMAAFVSITVAIKKRKDKESQPK